MNIDRKWQEMNFQFIGEGISLTLASTDDILSVIDDHYVSI